MKTLWYLLSLVATCAHRPATAIIGYDCRGHALNLTTVSLLDVVPCDIPSHQPIRKDVKIQLLQLSEYDGTDISQCKVEVDRTIFYCGMHSHISAVQNGRREYIMDVTPYICKQMQTLGMLSFTPSTHISGLQRNQTNLRSLTLAGEILMDGTCKGAQYSDPYGTWNDVVVQASIKITLRNGYAPIKLSTERIILPSGQRCNVAEGSCMDTDGGNTFWSPIPEDSCHFRNYDVLYEGMSSQLTPEDDKSPTVYTVISGDTVFALARTTEFPLCGYTLVKTEHPKLFILEIKQGQTFKARTGLNVDNLDIFTYINSKFVYVEKHLRNQMTTLYQDVLKQKCQIEQQVLVNALTVARTNPDEFAYTIMKGPGYTAAIAGEVAHIIKCIPAECRFRSTETCYHQLPVTYSNDTWFLSPRSRILSKTGTPRDCNEVLPIMYHMHNRWYRLTPKPVETIDPPSIQPLTRSTWRYVDPANLATSGIYSESDLQKLRDHIMFPVEKPAMLDTLARGAMGQQIPHGTVSMYNLMDEESLDKIAQNAGQRVWGVFMTFGSASAGVIGIFLIIRLVKLVIDIIIHGYALHSVYGWSLHLLGAIWGSVTNLLIHLARGPPPQDPEAGAPAPIENQQPPENKEEKVSVGKSVRFSDLRSALEQETL